MIAPKQIGVSSENLLKEGTPNSTIFLCKGKEVSPPNSTALAQNWVARRQHGTVIKKGVFGQGWPGV
jgi:hypothetical protein